MNERFQFPKNSLLPQSSSAIQTGILQRKCESCHTHTVAGGKCEECANKKGALQRKSSNNSELLEVPPIVHEVLQSSGQPLDKEIRAFFETRFTHDFSNVRVHTDAKAAESAQAVNALAYTVGQNVVLGAGQYAPATSAGQRLLAHELTHVMQQGGNAQALQQNSKFSEEDDHYEQQAERSATQCMNGTQIQVPSIISSPLIQRTKICSKRLDNPLGIWFNHSYIDDTGRDNCLGNSMVGNYAIQELCSGNFLRGCAIKTDRSTDPQGYTPNVKQCTPKPGVTDLSKCLRNAFNSYSDPSLYENPSGPNSNTFAATLAKTCCADGSSSGLGRVPGWDHPPAPPCPDDCILIAGIEESPREEVAA